MNKLLKFKTLAAILACMVAIQASAYDFMDNGIYYTVNGTNVTVANNGSFNTYSGDIVIPATVTHDGSTYNVTSIGFQSFYNCTGLTSVSIPEGVNYIMGQAFYNCSSLTSITLPSTLYTIYTKAFAGCSGLTTVTCLKTTPPSMASDAFDADAFSRIELIVPMGSLSNYQSSSPWSSFSSIQETDKFMVNNIYYRETGSNTVEVTYRDKNYNYYSGNISIPSTVNFSGKTYTVTGIGNSAFRSSPRLTGLTIPSTVTYIDYAAFYECLGLTQISIPSSITTLGDFAFMSCSSLETIYLHNTAVTAISRQCFTSCTSLETITFPSTLKDISYFAFYSCTALSSASLPLGLESIQYSAFEGCTSLTSVTIPSSVTYIGKGSFSDCRSMVSYNVNSMNQNYKSVDGVLFDIAMDTLLLYPNMHSPVYEIPYGVQIIANLAFYGCDNVTSVTFPWSVRHIGTSAFGACVNLETIDLPSSVEYIGGSAFSDCSKLETVLIPSSVTYIGDNSFSDCGNLKAINVDENNSCYKSDYGVLYTMDGHKIIQYPCARPDKHYSVLNTTDTIGDMAFYNSNLKSVYLPKSLKSMGYRPFTYSKVERVVIDEGLEIIPREAFYGCEGMRSLYLPSTIKAIGDRAFVYLLNLEQLTIAVNGNVPTIGENAFYGLGYYTPNQSTTVYVPSGMASKYDNIDEWLNGMGEFTDIVPIAIETEFSVDSLNMVTTDDMGNAMVTGVTSKSVVDPGIPPKVAVNGNLCTVTALGYNSMQNCTSMLRAEVPFSVTWMDDYSFYGCTNIQELRLHEGLKEIDPFSVSHINAMPILRIPASVDSISGTFVNYSYGLAHIEVDKDNPTYTSFSGVLFSKDRKRLVAYPYAHGTKYSVPTGTEVIVGSSFRGSALTQVTLPSTLRSIEGSAFFDNKSLTSVVVPSGVVTIGNSAFGSCTAMTSAELPETLTSLGYNAFYNVPGLVSLTVKNPTPPTCVIYTNPHTHTMSIPFMDVHFTQCTLYVPRGSKQAYQAANIWKNFTNIVEIDMPTEVKRGDVNGDGQVTISDVTALIDYLLGGGDISLDAADVNLDNHLTISDVTALIDYLLSGEWPNSTIDMWYLIGSNVGSQQWDNYAEGVGYGLIPLYPRGEFDSRGHGVLTYTGYFGGNDYIAILHTPGSWDDRWGTDSNGNFIHGDSEEVNAFSMDYDGYYTITLNTATNEFGIMPYIGEIPGPFNAAALTGTHIDWDINNDDYDMTRLNSFKENHDWIFRDFIVTGNGNELKFTADDDWQNNWGDNTFPWGQGVLNGFNVPVKAGTYDVYFNDITGDFHFYKK